MNNIPKHFYGFVIKNLTIVFAIVANWSVLVAVFLTFLADKVEVSRGLGGVIAESNLAISCFYHVFEIITLK